MHRCLELAKLGAGNVAPNPMVGAVLVHNSRIIGEGYHQQYGQPHAESNCIGSVKEEDKHLISGATMYVSLEPCAHYGKTPPCADLIIKHKIPKVVIGSRDPFAQVNGKGIEKLQAASIKIEVGVLENECRELNKRFFTFHEQHRPYIILKWAQSVNQKIAAHPQPFPKGRETESVNLKGRLHISNDFTNRVVHKWRSEEAAILVGTNTALMDDPQLTTRLWTGNNPIRLVVDMDLKLSSSLKLFDDEAPTIVFNKIKHDLDESFFENFFMTKRGKGLFFYQVTEDIGLVHQIINALYQLKIQSVIVEGGSRLLQSFIDEGMWDEARVITNRQLTIGNGLSSPILQDCQKIEEINFTTDTIETFKLV
jgi:diaminohydroxyphosphoribosylaminopyrimidine deaminase/5-amino-6-(5-phosphoribosylamino)uracil reductase